eukprot:11213259-Alexandrium_andersonii.AAC.1
MTCAQYTHVVEEACNVSSMCLSCSHPLQPGKVALLKRLMRLTRSLGLGALVDPLESEDKAMHASTCRHDEVGS